MEENKWNKKDIIRDKTSKEKPENKRQTLSPGLFDVGKPPL